MLSSRPHNLLFADKENAQSHGYPQTTTRKGASTYTSAQAAAFAGAKTPAVKQSAVSSFGLNGCKTIMKTGKKQQNGAFTVALEPGARVLGAKDGNNRQKTAMKDKGKQKEESNDAECSKIQPTILFRDAMTAPKKNVQATSTAVNQSAQKMTAKTPAKSVRNTVLKTPGPSIPALEDDMPDMSLYKTPSPNQLSRRRKGIMPSPVPFDFGRPISLRSDSVPESIEEMAAPTPQELLQIELDKIDEDQEVEYAGPRVLPEDIPYEPDFDMPNYKEMDLVNACFFPGRFLEFEYDSKPNLSDVADRAVIPQLIDEITIKDFSVLDSAPLFPVVKASKALARSNPGIKPVSRLNSSRYAQTSSLAQSRSSVQTSRRTASDKRGAPYVTTSRAALPAGRTAAPSSVRSSSTASSSTARPAQQAQPAEEFGDFRLEPLEFSL